MQQPADPLAQLETFLRTDPGNDILRIEIFEAALRRGEFDRAEIHLREALARGENALAWRLHEAHLFMARRHWPDARRALDALRHDPQAPSALAEAASIDTAQVALQQGDATAGATILRPLVNSGGDQPLAVTVQVLWLRLLHRTGQLQEAVDWAAARWRAGQLAPAAAGVASLAALDQGDLATCEQWADNALKQAGVQMEALVARASVSLAEQHTDAARQYLQKALQHNPDDGRARSALAFTELQAGHLEAARREFEAAVVQFSSHIGTWHGLGWTCLLQQDVPAARQAFETALEIDRNFAESHGGLAVVQVQQGQTAQAREGIERALRLDGACLSAHYAQALLDGTAKDVDHLRRLAQRLLSAKTGSVRKGLSD